MKIAIIGCGSIGQRHIKNLLALKYNSLVAFDIDAKKLAQVTSLHSEIQVTTHISTIWQSHPDVVFITTPTALHVSYALTAAKRNFHLFIEKPLSHTLAGSKKLLSIVNKNELITMVGCNMRFYWAIAKIKEIIHQRKLGIIYFAHIEYGYYLPFWHPKTNYRLSYSAQKKLGGGVVLDVIHELDYARWILGDFVGVKSIAAKISDLSIDTEDTADILLKTKTGTMVSIHLDYLQHIYNRSCKIVGEKGMLTWDINTHKLSFYENATMINKTFSEPESYDLNQMYVDEIKYFLRCVKRKQKTINDIQYAQETLRIALLAKKIGLRYGEKI